MDSNQKRCVCVCGGGLHAENTGENRSDDLAVSVRFLYDRLICLFKVRTAVNALRLCLHTFIDSCSSEIM